MSIAFARNEKISSLFHNFSKDISGQSIHKLGTEVQRK